MARKTKKRKSCPSGRAYASGKKKGRCVPKGGKARRVHVKRGGRRGCFAKTRDAAIAKMDLFKKTAIEREQKRAAANAAEVAAAVRAEEGADWTASEFGGLHRRRRRFRRR